jgi:hypothetical protein
MLDAPARAGLDDTGIVETDHPISASQLAQLAQQTSLRARAFRNLQGMELSQSVVTTAVTNKDIPGETLDRLNDRFGEMNRYGDEQEDGHVEDTAGPERDFPHMGVTTVYVSGKNNGKREDLAYAVMYPASVDHAVAERTGTFSNGCVAEGTSEYFADCLQRVNWDDMAATLSQKVPGRTVGTGDIMHLYDYAVGPNAENLEGNGLARVTLKLLQGHLKDNQFLLGFIDSTPPEKADDLDHRKSTLASMSTGCFLAGTVPTSHDGDHPSILVAYSPSVEPNFSAADQVIAQRDQKGHIDLGKFVTSCEQLLDANPGKVVALDPQRQAYVLTTLRNKAPEGSEYLLSHSG